MAQGSTPAESTPDPQAALAGHLAVIEDYSDAQPMSSADLQARQKEGTFPVPSGWSLDSGCETTLSITIVDQGPTGKTSVSTSVPVQRGFLSRGQETIQLDVTYLTDQTARAWADYVEVPGSLQSVPLGRGFASGKSAVIDRGDSLLRVEYNGGTHNVLNPVAVQARVQALLTKLG